MVAFPLEKLQLNMVYQLSIQYADGLKNIGNMVMMLSPESAERSAH